MTCNCLFGVHDPRCCAHRREPFFDYHAPIDFNAEQFGIELMRKSLEEATEQFKLDKQENASNQWKEMKSHGS